MDAFPSSAQLKGLILINLENKIKNKFFFIII